MHLIEVLYICDHNLRDREYLPHFTNGETGIQKGDAIMQRSHCKCFEEPGKELRSVWVQMVTHNHRLYHLITSTPSLVHSHRRPFPWKPPTSPSACFHPSAWASKKYSLGLESACGSWHLVVYLGPVNSHTSQSQLLDVQNRERNREESVR